MYLFWSVQQLAELNHRPHWLTVFLFLARSQLVSPTSTRCPWRECTPTEPDFCRKITCPGYRVTEDTYVKKKQQHQKLFPAWVNLYRTHCDELFSCQHVHVFLLRRRPFTATTRTTRSSELADRLVWFNGAPCCRAATTATMRGGASCSHSSSVHRFFLSAPTCSVDLRGTKWILWRTGSVYIHVKPEAKRPH